MKPISQQTGYDSNEWYTPALYIEVVRGVLRGIDLDPASCAKANEVVQAKRFMTKEQDGLSYPWHGRVFMNPPYSRTLCSAFVNKLAEEYHEGRVTEAIVLVNNQTSAKWFHTLAAASGRMCLLKRRIRFWRAEGKPVSPRQGQVFFYLGINPGLFVQHFTPLGPVWRGPNAIFRE